MSLKFQMWCSIGKRPDRTGITRECVESDKTELNSGFSEAFRPEERRVSGRRNYLASVYMNKVDVRECRNLRGVDESNDNERVGSVGMCGNGW